MRGTKAIKTFPNQRVGRVDQLLHASPPPSSVMVTRQARKAPRKIGHHFVQRAVFLGVAEVGHRHSDGSQAMGMISRTLLSARMGARVSLQELPSIFKGKVTDLENGR